MCVRGVPIRELGEAGAQRSTVHHQLASLRRIDEGASLLPTVPCAHMRHRGEGAPLADLPLPFLSLSLFLTHSTYGHIVHVDKSKTTRHPRKAIANQAHLQHRHHRTHRIIDLPQPT
jgi:hypothetical protein